MFQFERILVPIDFSDRSLSAASQAGALSRHFHSKVTLPHVSEFLVIHPLTGPLGSGITSWDRRAQSIWRCRAYPRVSLKKSSARPTSSAQYCTLTREQALRETHAHHRHSLRRAR